MIELVLLAFLSQAPVPMYISNTVPSASPCNSRMSPVVNPTTGAFYICKAGVVTNISGGGGGGGGGTVTSVSGSGPSWLTWTIGTPTTTPSISLAPTTGQSSHQVIGTCDTATTFVPCALVAGDIPSLPYVPTSRNINTTTPITGGGDLSADRTIACATCVTSAASLTSNLPVFGAGSQAAAVGTRSGNTTEVVTTTGGQTSGHCVSIDANGNHIDAGAACGGGSGGGGTNTGCPATNTNVAGWVCLESHTASTSSELDFTTCLATSGFDQFTVQFIGLVPTATGGAVAIEMSTNGGMTYDTSTSNYSWGGLRWTNNNANGSNGTIVYAYIDLTGFDIVNPVANFPFTGTWNLYSFTSSSLYKRIEGQSTYHTTSTIEVSNIGFGTYLSTTAVNAFRIYMQTHSTAAYTQATTIASGTVRCYGIQH